jgi:hypothetical protein
MVAQSEGSRYLFDQKYLQNVDVKVVQRSVLVAWLQQASIQDIGSEAVVFRVGPLEVLQNDSSELTPSSTDQSYVVRLPLCSVLGKATTLGLLQAHRGNSGVSFQEKIDYLSAMSDRDYAIRARHQQFRIKQRVAFANANFAATPHLTIPINVMLAVDGRTCATFEKRIVGRKPLHTEFMRLRNVMDATGAEYAEGNAFLDVIGYDGLPLHALHVIDFSRMPLDKEAVLKAFEEYVNFSVDEK